MQGQTLFSFARAVVLVVGSVVGFMATMGPDEATSNISRWLELFGMDQVPGFLSAGAADSVTLGGAVFLIVFVLTHWIFRSWFARISTQMKQGHTMLYFAMLIIAVSAIGGAFGVYLLTKSLSEPPALKEHVAKATDATEGKPEVKRYKKRPDEMEFGHIVMLEFPNSSFTSSETIERGEYGQHPAFEFLVMLDRKLNAEFVVVHVPPTGNTFAVGKLILEKQEEMRKSLHPSEEVVERMKQDKKFVANAPLNFTGKVFIYHESPLSNEKRQELESAYDKAGLVVGFRDQEYMAAAREKAAAHFSFAKEK